MPKRMALARLAALVIAAVSVAPALAQQPPGTERELKARQEYEDGIAQYNIMNYDRAIEHFKKAYELTQAPALLFNIAQAYRLKKDWQAARTAYQNYHREQSRRNPNDPNLQDALNFIAEMDQAIREGGGTPAPTGNGGNQATPAPPPPKSNGPTESPPSSDPPETAPPVQAETPDEPTRPGTTMKWVGVGVAAGGVVSLGLMTAFLLKADKINDRVEEYCRMPDGMWTCQEYEEHRHDEGATADTYGIVAGVVGGAMIVGGGVLFYLGWQKERSTSLTVAPEDGGATLVFSGSF